MSSLFKKYLKESKSDELSKSPNYFFLIQDQWSKKMGSLAARLSKKRLLVLLGLFVITTGGGYICIVLNSFSKTTAGSITISSMAKPIDVFEKSPNSALRPVLDNEREGKKINRFRIYLKSLARSPTEKRTKESSAEN